MSGTTALPAPDELAESFWAGCARGELLVPECQDCKKRFFVPEIVCPSCWSSNWEWVRSPGVGEVYSYTVVERAASAGFEVPYVLAAVDLDDGWTMMTNVVGCDPHGVRIGMRVAVRFEQRPGTGTVPAFAPLDPTR